MENHTQRTASKRTTENINRIPKKIPKPSQVQSLQSNASQLQPSSFAWKNDAKQFEKTLQQSPLHKDQGTIAGITENRTIMAQESVVISDVLYTTEHPLKIMKNPKSLQPQTTSTIDNNFKTAISTERSKNTANLKRKQTVLNSCSTSPTAQLLQDDNDNKNTCISINNSISRNQQQLAILAKKFVMYLSKHKNKNDTFTISDAMETLILTGSESEKKESTQRRLYSKFGDFFCQFLIHFLGYF